jgi:hypothetical protein
MKPIWNIRGNKSDWNKFAKKWMNWKMDSPESYFAFAQIEAFKHSTVPEMTFSRPSLNFS